MVKQGTMVNLMGWTLHSVLHCILQFDSPTTSYNHRKHRPSNIRLVWHCAAPPAKSSSLFSHIPGPLSSSFFPLLFSASPLLSSSSVSPVAVSSAAFQPPSLPSFPAEHIESVSITHCTARGNLSADLSDWGHCYFLLCCWLLTHLFSC